MNAGTSRTLLRVADWLEILPRRCLQIAAWMMVLMVAAIVFEVITRRMRVEVPIFTSVRLLELQWHFHVTLFMLCLAYGYLRNAHVRIDMAVSGLSARTRAWIELIGLLVLFLPFVAMLTRWGYVFWEASWRLNEASDNPSGLPHRWLIKPVMPIGAALLIMAGICNMLRLVVFLFGPPSEAQRADPVLAR
jgi:TRAP-type mannitol/chloroaromatic compound transport system permease small subunit